MEAAQRFLEAKERYPAGSKGWARATAMAFNMLKLEECAEVAKPEWWSDEGLKALEGAVGEGCEGGAEGTIREQPVQPACGPMC